VNEETWMAKRTARPKKETVKAQAADTWRADAATPTDDDVRARAYQRYLERGGEHGADFDDWLAAERDLRKE
jgi:hypothetical protein